MGNWNTTFLGGGVTPDAPNVLNAGAHLTTVTPVYDCPFNDSVFKLSISISLDITNANIGHLRLVHITDTATGKDVAQFAQPAGGWIGQVVTFDTDQVSQGRTALTGQFSFRCANEDNHVTSFPVNVSYTVNASLMNNFAGASEQVAYPRTADKYRVIYMTLGFQPVPANWQVPQNISYAVSEDGVSFTYVGWEKMTVAWQTFRFMRPAPGATGTAWAIAACTGAFQWPAGQSMTLADLAAHFFVVSSPFTVQGLALPSATACSTAAIAAGAGGGNPYNASDKDGRQWVRIPGPTWVDPTDNNAAFMRITGKCVDALGNPAPADQGGTEVVLMGPNDPLGDQVSPGATRATDALEFDYNPAGSIYVYWEERMHLMNRNATSTGDWFDPTKSVLQTVAWGGATYKRVLFGSLPAGRLRIDRADPTTVLPGVQVTSIAGPANAGMTLSCPITNGASLASGVVTYCWDGTVVLPSDPTYNGAEITVQYAGSAEGGAFATLSKTQTTFHNGDWPRPAADIAVTFRAYPVSRDGQRGTPVTYSTTVTAAGYVSPVIPAPAAMVSITVTITDGPDSSTGEKTYGWTGVLARPSDLTNYNGCQLTQAWDGGAEGGSFQTLPAGQTTFQSDRYYPKQTAPHTVVFRAYPVSASNQRGTAAATAALTVPASGSYVPPVIPAPGAMTSISVTITAGQPNPAGVETYGWTGTVVRPADLTNYNGCQLTQTWDGGAEGGTFQTLSATQTTFQSDQSYPKAAVGHTVVFKAYPISPSSQRGTPAITGTITIPAAGTYVPPVAGAPVASQNFELGNFGDWTVTDNCFSIDAAAPISGTYSLKTLPPGTTAYFFRDVWCRPGAQIAAEIKYKSTGASAACFYAVIVFYDGSGGLLTWNQIELTPNIGPVTLQMGPYTAPSTAAAARLLFQLQTNSPGHWWLDDLKLFNSAGSGVILHPITGVPTLSNSNPPSSVLQDWDFRNSALGAMAWPGTAWIMPWPSCVIRDDGDGFGHYCRITGVGVLSQIVVAMTQGTLRVNLQIRSNNPGGTHAIYVLLDWQDSRGIVIREDVISASGYFATWTTMQSDFIAPAGTYGMTFRVSSSGSENPAGIWDVGKIIAQVRW